MGATEQLWLCDPARSDRRKSERVGPESNARQSAAEAPDQADALADEEAGVQTHARRHAGLAQYGRASREHRDLSLAGGSEREVAPRVPQCAGFRDWFPDELPHWNVEDREADPVYHVESVPLIYADGLRESGSAEGRIPVSSLCRARGRFDSSS